MIEISRSNDPEWRVLDTTLADATTYTDSTYHTAPGFASYRMYAVVGDERSAYSNETTVVFLAVDPTPEPTYPAPRRGDLNCDSQIDMDDALVLFRTYALGDPTLPSGCPSIVVGWPGVLRGDFNCDYVVNIVDVLPLLKREAGLDPDIPEDCPPFAE